MLRMELFVLYVNCSSDIVYLCIYIHVVASERNHPHRVRRFNEDKRKGDTASYPPAVLVCVVGRAGGCAGAVGATVYVVMAGAADAASCLPLRTAATPG